MSDRIIVGESEVKKRAQARTHIAIGVMGFVIAFFIAIVGDALEDVPLIGPIFEFVAAILVVLFVIGGLLQLLVGGVSLWIHKE